MNNTNTTFRLVNPKEARLRLSVASVDRLLEAVCSDTFVGVFEVDGETPVETGNGLVVVTAVPTRRRGVVWSAYDAEGELVDSASTFYGLLASVAD